MRIRLDAYVHRWDIAGGTWKGTGWIQPVQIALTDAEGDASIELPVDISGGELQVGQVQHHNLVPLPFRSSESVWLRLELATSKVLQLKCRSIAIEPAGQAQYLEDLPDDFKPLDID